jgi:hypothetical protein
VKRLEPILIGLIWLELGSLLFLIATLAPWGPAQTFRFAMCALILGAIWSAVRAHERALQKPGKGKNHLSLDPDF